MSDRLVFLPYRHPHWGDDVSWADVVIREGASVNEIHEAVETLFEMGGPYKIFGTQLDRDSRYAEFDRFAQKQYGVLVKTITVMPVVTRHSQMVDFKEPFELLMGLADDWIVDIDGGNGVLTARIRPRQCSQQSDEGVCQ